MKLNELFKKKTVCSFEIFPPKPDMPVETVYDTLEALRDLRPDYISVTYGAGGSQSKRTAEIAALIKNKYGIEPLPHLTALYQTEESVMRFAEDLRTANIENVLALRGDRVTGAEPAGVFVHASDLVAFLKRNTSLNIVGAGYPEGHYESPNLAKDIENLKIKVLAGVTHINTQLFFDNGDFYAFIDRARAAGITIPIQAGIMPLVNKRQIDRIIMLSGAKIPAGLARIIARYADNPEAFMSAGIAYATSQLVDLLAQGVDGVHLYIMNRPDVARRIKENISTLF
jgi:methylenetetrahydrofolate reductase (NADPH)